MTEHTTSYVLDSPRLARDLARGVDYVLAQQALSFVGLVASCGFLALFTSQCKLLLGLEMDRLAFLAHRQFFATVIILPVAWATEGFQMPSRELVWPLFGVGMFLSLNLGGYLVGLGLTSAFATTVAQLFIPALGLVFGCVLNGERLTSKMVFWTIGTMSGCGLAVLNAIPEPLAVVHAYRPSVGVLEPDDFHYLPPARFSLGMFVLLLQCASYVCFAMVQGRILNRCPHLLSVVAWTQLLTAVAFGATAAFSGHGAALFALAHSRTELLAVVFAALFPTLGSLLLTAYATKWLPVSLVSSASAAFVPVWSSVFQWLLDGHGITLTAAFGDLIATISMIILAQEQRQQEMLRLHAIPKASQLQCTP